MWVESEMNGGAIFIVALPVLGGKFIPRLLFPSHFKKITFIAQKIIYLMSNTNTFITHIRDLIAKDDFKTAVQQFRLC
jgi:hypothetical protein